MQHETALISTLAVGLACACIGGLLASLLRLPPLVGYLLAGIAIGPFTPGFVADAGIAGQLAEIGVVLMMFGVGMHFSLRDLLAVRKIALPGAIVQIAIATALGLALARSWGWTSGAGLVFGLALSVASTVVLLRALEERQILGSETGRITVGWLVVEDLVMVLTVVALPALSGALGGHGEPGSARELALVLGVTLAKVVAFIALMLVVGARVLPFILDRVAKTGSRELFTLAVITAALGIGFGAAELFDVSFALGAFFAGLVVNESDHSHRAATELQPLQDVFVALFFVSVGMLFDPAILVREPLAVGAVLAVIVLGKSLVALVIALACRYPIAIALTIAASLAQIGEFSFILGGLGVELGLLPAEGLNLILAGALLSITLNPPLFRLASRNAA
jgi:K+:H+ antiporter